LKKPSVTLCLCVEKLLRVLRQPPAASRPSPSLSAPGRLARRGIEGVVLERFQVLIKIIKIYINEL